MAGYRPHKKSHANCAAEVEKWLGKMITDTSQVAISAIQIEVPESSTIIALRDNDIFKVAFARNKDSDLHSLLKYVAWTWLDQKEFVTLGYQSDMIRFEQIVYSPPLEEPEFRLARNPGGGDFDWTMAQLIRRGDDAFLIPEGGKRYTVDVFGKATNIEVGSTTPECLLTPLFEDLSNRAVWIPFPKGIRPKDFRVDSHEFESVTAYEIVHSV